MTEHVDYVVVGLGALGSAAAYELAARGQQVLGLEQFELGHHRGASHDTSRILRRSYHTPAYVRLAGAAYDDWAALSAASEQQLVTVTGGIDLFPPDPAIPIADYTSSLEACGVPFEILDPDQVAARWPRVCSENGMACRLLDPPLILKTLFVELKVMTSFMIPLQFHLRRTRPIWTYCPGVGAWCQRHTSTFQGILLLLILVFSLCGNRPAYAEATKAAPTEETDEVVEVEKIQDKYWEQGSTAEIGVVQNRLYSKKRKIELGLFGNNLSSDPFLSVYTLGGSLGYHFTEFFSAHLFAWDAFVSPSSALTTLQNDLKTTANTNQPKFFYGTEVKGSFIYGKLSVLGAFIAYFDAYFTAGAGVIGTESGNNPAIFAGIGQQIHVSQIFSLNIDYRYLGYNETIIGKVAGPNLGQILGVRTNISGVVTLGVSVLFNFFR